MLVFLKSKQEIEGFKKAGKIASNILELLINNLKSGKTTKELNEIAIEECEKAGATPAFLNYNDFPYAICSSVNNVLVHGFPDDTKLDNNIISIDIGVNYDGFIGDTAETVGDHQLISACQLALTSAIEIAKPRTNLIEIANIISKTAKEHNFQIPKKYGGHGIDRNKLHSNPFIANIPEEAVDIRLRPGMLIAIEPMFVDGDATTTTNGWPVLVQGNAAHCEHTVLITESEPIVLTRRNKC